MARIQGEHIIPVVVPFGALAQLRRFAGKANGRPLELAAGDVIAPGKWLFLRLESVELVDGVVTGNLHFNAVKDYQRPAVQSEALAILINAAINEPIESNENEPDPDDAVPDESEELEENAPG